MTKSFRDYLAEAEDANREIVRPARAVPEHIRTRYLRGGCFAFALAMKRLTKRPLWGMFEGDDLHHAFVADPETKIGYDIRGAVPFERMHEGSRVTAPELRPIKPSDIVAVVGAVPRGDIAEAKRVACSHLSNFLP